MARSRAASTSSSPHRPTGMPATTRGDGRPALSAALVMRGTTCVGDGTLVGHPEDGAVGALPGDPQHHRAERGEQHRRRRRSVTSRGLWIRKRSFSTSTGLGPRTSRRTRRGSPRPTAPVARRASPSMVSMTQWCDGPTPRLNRPPQAACTDSACCPSAIGWRGLQRHHRGRRARCDRSPAPSSATAVMASKSCGSCGIHAVANPASSASRASSQSGRPCPRSCGSRARSSIRCACRRPSRPRARPRSASGRAGCRSRRNRSCA